eukprot:3146089-Alexandrium_andersonii.AAC.1
MPRSWWGSMKGQGRPLPPSSTTCRLRSRARRRRWRPSSPYGQRAMHRPSMWTHMHACSPSWVAAPERAVRRALRASPVEVDAVSDGAVVRGLP